MMRRTIKILLPAILIIMAGCGRETRDEALTREAMKITQNECPQQVDEYTRLDSVVYLPETRTMLYAYTVYGLIDVDSLYTEEFRDDYHQGLLRQVKNNISWRRMKDEKLTFRFLYMSEKTGKELLLFDIVPEDYTR